jgi:hypothetical protein
MNQYLCVHRTGGERPISIEAGSPRRRSDCHLDFLSTVKYSIVQPATPVNGQVLVALEQKDTTAVDRIMFWTDWRLFPPQAELRIARRRNRRRSLICRRRQEAPSWLNPLYLCSVNNLRSERLYGMVTRYMCLAM